MFVPIEKKPVEPISEPISVMESSAKKWLKKQGCDKTVRLGLVCTCLVEQNMYTCSYYDHSL